MQKEMDVGRDKKRSDISVRPFKFFVIYLTQ